MYRKLIRRAAVLLWGLLLAWLPSALSAATIILIRHADRSSNMSVDALLSLAGEERARQLSGVLKDAKIQRIYVTEVRRTQQTAEPLAARLHLKPRVIAKQDLGTLVGQLKKSGNDETILVVGHSDTVPLIVEGLGGRSIPPFRDTEYDRMIIVSTGAAGQTQVVTLRYGNVAP